MVLVATQWEGIQIPILDMFRCHVSGIPSEAATISESESVDDDTDYGAKQLVLELAPTSDRYCHLLLWVNSRFCHAAVGRYALCRLFSTGADGWQGLPDRVEIIVEAVLEGRVWEETWFWKDKLLQSVSWMNRDCEIKCLDFQLRGLGLLRELLPNVSHQEFSYEPYPTIHAK